MKVDLRIEGENRRWVQSLGATGRDREIACQDLYPLLLRVARREVVRRAPGLRMFGPELEDIAHQSAGDALMAISDRLDRFRGESRFTTWASKFVIFDVATKMNRHAWRRHDVLYDQDDWSRLVSRFEVPPDEQVQAREFVEAVSSAVRRCLSERQRIVFMATVVRGMPVDALAEELGSTSNALYKVLFDARKKLRAALVAAGHLPEARSDQPETSRRRSTGRSAR